MPETYASPAYWASAYWAPAYWPDTPGAVVGYAAPVYWAPPYWSPSYWGGSAAPVAGPVSYRIFANDGAGGPVDYGTVLATTATLAWTSGPLAPDTDWTFAVRAYDSLWGLEDRNTDARVRVRIGPAGEDLTGLPNPPIHLTARAGANGAIIAEWRYNAAGQGAPPVGFRVYRGTPTVSYTTPVATILFGDDRMPYATTLAGGLDATAYEVSVRSYNATGEESNTAAVSVTARVAGPAPVAGLAGSSISS